MPTDPGFWTTEVNAVLNAWALFVIAVGLMGIAIWRVVNWASSHQIEGLRAQIEALEQRLELARDQFAKATEEKNKLQKDVEEQQRKVATNAALKPLEGNTASLAARLITLNHIWDMVGTTISPPDATYADTPLTLRTDPEKKD